MLFHFRLQSLNGRPPNILSSGCSVCHAQSLGPGVWLGLAVYSSHLLMGVGSVPSHRDWRCSTRCLSHNCQPLRDVCKLSQSLWGWLGVSILGGEAEVVRRVWGEVAISFLRHRDTLKGKGRRLRCGRVNRDSPLSRDLARETLSTHRKHGTQN